MTGFALSLTLSELAVRLAPAGARLVGDGQVRVSSLDDDSRTALAGSLFVARTGEHVDGAEFVAAARARGARAVLCLTESGIDSEPRLEVDDLPLAFGLAAQELYGRPSDTLKVVGITGTNGKTTTASLVDQALRFLGTPVARLGTLGFFIGEELVFETLTTPLPHRLAEALAIARARGVQVVVMEVSSHALAQRRIAGVRFEVAAFTNLSQDHLDYHKTLEAYAETKARLFTEYAPAHSVIFTGGAFGRELLARVPGALSVATQGEPARISAENARISANGIEATVRVGEAVELLRSRLVGLHNLENLLVSLGILISLGIELPRALFALAQATSVPGRLERCDGPEDDLLAVVDYAHTPDALRRVLAALRATSERPLVCVFGCGGDRDRAKRAPMARAVAEGADVVWLTSDNPRTEDPARILADAREGLVASNVEFFEESDRARAIERAILMAPPSATVLIAGKGHESYQLIGGQSFPFDDRVETRAALRARRLLRQGDVS